SFLLAGKFSVKVPILRSAAKGRLLSLSACPYFLYIPYSGGLYVVPSLFEGFSQGERSGGNRESPRGIRGLVVDFRLELDLQAGVSGGAISGVVLGTEVDSVRSRVFCANIPAVVAIDVILVDGSASAEFQTLQLRHQGHRGAHCN